MRIVIAAGGTGGHMYPAIAYAKAFQQHDPGGHILFVGTGKAVEEKKCLGGFSARMCSVIGNWIWGNEKG